MKMISSTSITSTRGVTLMSGHRSARAAVGTHAHRSSPLPLAHRKKWRLTMLRKSDENASISPSSTRIRAKKKL